MTKCKGCEKELSEMNDIYCMDCEHDIFDYFANKCKYLEGACDKNYNTAYACTHEDNGTEGSVSNLEDSNIPEGVEVNRCFKWDCPLRKEFREYLKEW